MLKRQVETNNKQVQTIIHCYPFILTSNNDLVSVNCNRSCQTAASTSVDKPNSDLYPLLEFTPYQLILEGALKEIDLPRKPLLHWKLQLSLTQLSDQTQLSKKSDYKSSLKKNNSTSNQSSSMSLPEVLRLSTDSDTQTDISVTPHILNVDEVASVFAEVGMQTTISCLPAASVSTILPQLKANLLHEKHNLYEEKGTKTMEDMSLEWRIDERNNIVGLVTVDKPNIKQRVYETYDDTSDTDEFEETTDELLPDYTKENIEATKLIKQEKYQNFVGQVKNIDNEGELFNFEVSQEETSIQQDEQIKDTTNEGELSNFEGSIEETSMQQEESKQQEVNDFNEGGFEEEALDPGSEGEIDESEDDDSNQDESIKEEQTTLKKNNCSCGSNALKKMADQFRSQAVTIQLTPELLPSGENYEQRVIEALNATMSVLQTEMARLMDAFSENQNIASTSCSCIDSPLNATDTVKIIVDEQRNTLQIKINQYTEIDELHVSRNPPGDHIGQTSVNVECECHPSHSGAAPPYSFAENNETYSCSKKIKPRSPIAPHFTAPPNNSCCNKASCHHSKIPTPVSQNHSCSMRGKRSENETNQCQASNKTCPKVKTTGSTGVQTELALGNRLQSESLNSLDDNCCSNSMPWNSISLPPPGTYSIKSAGNPSVGLKGTSGNLYNSVPIRGCRSCGPHTEMPWTDILIPQSNATGNMRGQASCSCRDTSTFNKKCNMTSEQSKPSITIKIKSPNVAQSKSCTNPSMSCKITTKPTSSVPDIQNETKATVCIKIVGQEDKEIIKEIALKPGDNTMTVNLDDIKTESTGPEETKEPEAEANTEEPITDEENTANGDTIEDTENNNKENVEETQKDSDSLFAPAECVCKDNVKFNTFKPDPVMIAMETCEAEMKPLRQALQELQMKVRNLNIPELKGCSCTLALEEHSKCISTLGTVRPDPANVPHFEDPSKLNTFGPCAGFKPPMFYVPDNSLPFGRLPPPALTYRNPAVLNTPICCQTHHQDQNNSSNKKKHHSCVCKKKKNGNQKQETHDESHKKAKIIPCKICTSTENIYEKESKSCMYVSSTETNSPFMYKRSSQNCHNNGNKSSPTQDSSSFKIKSKDTSSHCGSVGTDHENLRYQAMLHNTEKRKQKKRKQPTLSHLKKSDFEALAPYHNVFDVQHLRLGQAVKTDPDDFLLPSNKSKLINDFRSPHLLWSSIFSKTLSK